MSRTSTTRWKRIRKEARAIAWENGIHNCPICGTGLDYEYSGRPNSAEVDHIIPHNAGGQDHIDNTQIICRWCNRQKSDGTGKKLKPTLRTIEPETKVPW